MNAKEKHLWCFRTWIGRFAWKRTFPADLLVSPADCLTENPVGITERLAWHQIMPPSINGRTSRCQAVSQEKEQGSGRPRSVRSEEALRQVEQQSVLDSSERSVRHRARGSGWNGPHWIRFCAKTCAPIHAGYKFVRRWHQRTGAGVWRWRSGSQSTRLSSTVSGSLTVRISGSAGTWTRVTRFTGATACLTRCWPSHSTPIKWQRGSPLDEKAFISGYYYSLSTSVGWFRRSTRSGTWNWNYLSGLKWRARLPMSYIVRFAIRFGIQWYRKFWHGMFIFDFIAEYLSIIFFGHHVTFKIEAIYWFHVNRNVRDAGPDVITKFTGDRIHSYRYISLRLVSQTYHLYRCGWYVHTYYADNYWKITRIPNLLEYMFIITNDVNANKIINRRFGHRVPSSVYLDS